MTLCNFAPGIYFDTTNQSGLLNIVGGCCGTTPEHIKAIADAVADIKPRKIPEIAPACRLSGLEPFTIDTESLFVNVGERCNVTGSAKFKRLILEENYDEAMHVGRNAKDFILNNYSAENFKFSFKKIFDTV